MVYRFPRQGRNEKKLEKGWGRQNLGKDETSNNQESGGVVVVV